MGDIFINGNFEKLRQDQARSESIEGQGFEELNNDD